MNSMQTSILPAFILAGLVMSLHSQPLQAQPIEIPEKFRISYGGSGDGLSLIPKPSSLQTADGSFSFAQHCEIAYDADSEEMRSLALDLSKHFNRTAGVDIPVVPRKDGPSSGTIRLTTHIANSESLGLEGYRLTVTPGIILLGAAQPAGIYYGIQTMKQLLEVTYLNPASGYTKHSIPCVDIEDRPAYPWRGMLLDCCRHFMTKEFIKRYIDLLAYHKMNVLHLHLTDDQGWRIEINEYPKLTEVGAWRGDEDERYGGYYTQDDLRELVAYAERRFIRVVPEFEMPGHATAAIAGYPELSCQGKPIPVQTQWGVFPDVFCPGKESTFTFIERVLDEILAIFPSEYIHIGGDEAPRTNWEKCEFCQKRMQEEGLSDEHQLQSYLIRRVEAFLTARGRRLIGWDEILAGGDLPATAIVQSWRGTEGAVSAGRLGLDTIVSPNSHVYFDYPPVKDPGKPAWMAITPMSKVYAFQVTPSTMTAEQARHVLGSECCMWTEYAPQESIDRQLFPRLCAFSEVVWTQPGLRVWDDFQNRMATHYRRLEMLGVDYFHDRSGVK